MTLSSDCPDCASETHYCIVHQSTQKRVYDNRELYHGESDYMLDMFDAIEIDETED